MTDRFGLAQFFCKQTTSVSKSPAQPSVPQPVPLLTMYEWHSEAPDGEATERHETAMSPALQSTVGAGLAVSALVYVLRKPVGELKHVVRVAKLPEHPAWHVVPAAFSAVPQKLAPLGVEKDSQPVARSPAVHATDGDGSATTSVE